MSDKYKEFQSAARLLEEKRMAIEQSLRLCEKEREALRESYSKSCDHPVRVCAFPVCAICYKLVSSASLKINDDDDDG